MNIIEKLKTLLVRDKNVAGPEYKASKNMMHWYVSRKEFNIKERHRKIKEYRERFS